MTVLDHLRLRAPSRVGAVPAAAPGPAHRGEILLLNGPNLGRLGTRRPEIYGHVSFAEIESAVRRRLAAAGFGLRSFQSELEGELVQAVHGAASCAGAVVNPGALMMAGWSLRDALEDFAPPWIEVHVSNIFARETFRHVSILSPLAGGVVGGLGPRGYLLATDAVIALARADPFDRASVT